MKDHLPRSEFRSAFVFTKAEAQRRRINTKQSRPPSQLTTNFGPDMSKSLCLGSDDSIRPPVNRDCRAFDFTLLFEDVVLQLVPAAVVTFVLLPRLAYLWKAPVKVVSNRLVVFKLVSKAVLFARLLQTLIGADCTHISVMSASSPDSVSTWGRASAHTSIDCCGCRQYRFDMCSPVCFFAREPAQCAPILHPGPLLLLRNNPGLTTHPNLMADC